MELGKATRQILTQSNKNLRNSSSPFHSAIEEARSLQGHLENQELELKVMKEILGNSPECCLLSEDGPECESRAFVLHPAFSRTGITSSLKILSSTQLHSC